MSKIVLESCVVLVLRISLKNVFVKRSGSIEETEIILDKFPGLTINFSKKIIILSNDPNEYLFESR